MLLKPTFSNALDPTFSNDLEPPLSILSENKTTTPETTEIIFKCPLEERCGEIQIQERKKGVQTYYREPYARPNDNNVLIYPDRRDSAPWAEQTEISWFHPEPNTKARQKREE